MKTLLERMRPTTFEDYIGNSQQIDSLRIYMRGGVNKDAVLLQGLPGTGKTTLAHLMAKEYGYEPIEINASDERGKKDLNRILSVVPIAGFGGKPKLPIIDECDGCSTSFLSKILDMDGKKILCSNEMLNWDMMRRIHQVVFVAPKKWVFKKVIKNAGFQPDDAPLSEFTSFRDALNWCEGGMLPPRKKVMSNWIRMLHSYLYSGGNPFVADLIAEKINHGDYVFLEAFREQFEVKKSIPRNIVKRRGHIEITGILER